MQQQLEELESFISIFKPTNQWLWRQHKYTKIDNFGNTTTTKKQQSNRKSSRNAEKY